MCLLNVSVAVSLPGEALVEAEHAAYLAVAALVVASVGYADVAAADAFLVDASAALADESAVVVDAFLFAQVAVPCGLYFAVCGYLKEQDCYVRALHFCSHVRHC